MSVRELDPDSSKVMDVVDIDEEEDNEEVELEPFEEVPPVVVDDDVSDDDEEVEDESLVEVTTDESVGRDGRLWKLSTVWTTGTICLLVMPCTGVTVKAVAFPKAFVIV